MTDVKGLVAELREAAVKWRTYLSKETLTYNVDDQLDRAADMLESLSSDELIPKDRFLQEVNDIRAEYLGRYLGAEEEIKRLRAEIESLSSPAREEDVARLIEALEFYADPETYAAIAFLGDPPCGLFVDDFDENYEHDQLVGPRPGKRARAVLALRPAPAAGGRTL